MKYLIAFLAGLMPLLTCAQDSLSLDPGLLFDDPAFLRLPEYPAGDRGGIAGQKIDMTPYCPTPGDQCGQRSCVGWSICNALVIRWAWEQGDTVRTEIDSHRFSPSFIYNQVKEGKDCNSGAYLHKGLDLVKSMGVCLLSDFPYLCSNCSVLPNKAQRKSAVANKITESERVFNPGDPPETILHNLLYALDWHNPVIVGMLVTPNFHGCKKGHGPWRPFPLGGGSEGHALVVVGYDEDARMLTLFNSYGSDWGDGGFVQMLFDDFVKQAKYGVVMKR